jgi:hypothetical protein
VRIREVGLRRSRGAPLATPVRWRQALADAPTEVSDPLLRLVDLLAEGLGAAERAGETILRGQARLLWRAALAEAPASVLEASLGALRIPDKTEPGQFSRLDACRDPRRLPATACLAAWN